MHTTTTSRNTVTVPGMGECVVLYPLNDARGGYRVRTRWTHFEFSTYPVAT